MSSVTGQAHGSAPAHSVGEVGAGERGDDALGLARAREVDARDLARARTGCGRRAIQTMPGSVDVVDVARLAGEQLGSSLRATGEPTYVVRSRWSPSRLLAAAAACTALTMFW